MYSTVAQYLEGMTELGIKLAVLSCNLLCYLFLNINSDLTVVERGGVIALLLIVTYALWKMVQSKDKSITKVWEDRMKDKDQQIQDLKDIINRKK